MIRRCDLIVTHLDIKMPKKENESRQSGHATKNGRSRSESPKKKDKVVKIEESRGSLNPVEMMVVIRNNDKTIVASYYGGSSNDKAEKNRIKQGVKQCINDSNKIEIGKRYSVSGDHSNAIHYTLDKQGRIYVIVTTKKYSVRLAFSALDEVKSEFSEEFGPKVHSATEESLSKISKDTLQEIVEKYADPASLDKLVAVQEKINVVKVVMNENIKQVLGLILIILTL